eukprot:scaffold302315_cov27-Tisochrysis_lutea.AAC.1
MQSDGARRERMQVARCFDDSDPRAQRKGRRRTSEGRRLKTRLRWEKSACCNKKILQLGYGPLH